MTDSGPTEEPTKRRRPKGRVETPPKKQRELNGCVLIVDDEPAILQFYESALVKAGYQVKTASRAKEAVGLVAAGGIDVVLSDIIMPDMDGMQLLRAVREFDFDLPVVLITAYPQLDTAVQAVELGALRYLTKPIELEMVIETAAYGVQVLRLARLKRQAMQEHGLAASEASDRAGLEASFDRAIERLWMAYQPIVGWGAQRIWGYEALVRSNDEVLSTPAALFSTAEKLHRLHDLGRRIRTLAAGIVDDIPRDVNLLVNLHPHDLNDSELFDPGSPLSAVAPRVILEITERASLHDSADLPVKLSQLRALGFRLAVDDLGAGYAGLTTFVRVEPELVKIDMSLVRDVDKDPRRLSLLTAMLDVCRRLDVDVVCEGIETEGELATLIGAHCELMQGFYFARPEAVPPKVEF